MTDPGTVDTYQSVADEYRERNADRTVVSDQVERFLAAVGSATGGSDARLVDVGCGPGWETATFAARGHDVLGIDLTPAFLRGARRNVPDAGFARMDMRSTGLDTGAFDGLWACASFLHVPREDAPGTLAEFHRIVRPGGVIHLSVKRGDGERKGEGYDGDERRFTLYQPDGLRELVADAGFAVGSVRADEWVELLARA